jgi:RNA polymerase sigma factor (TIGR02999 family)
MSKNGGKSKAETTPDCGRSLCFCVIDSTRITGVDSEAPADITALLKAWGRGEQEALEDLVPMVRLHLRRIAKRYLTSGDRDAVLDTGVLINEAYLRLIDSKAVSWNDRAHFFAVCSKIMRHILVDHARTRLCARRGGGRQMIPFDEGIVVSEERSPSVIALDEALDALAKIDNRKSRVVELRFFGGLTVEEVAAVLGISPETVHRDWRIAKLWLAREMKRSGRRGG